jgi:hypothetical protein
MCRSEPYLPLFRPYQTRLSPKSFAQRNMAPKSFRPLPHPNTVRGHPIVRLVLVFCATTLTPAPITPTSTMTMSSIPPLALHRSSTLRSSISSVKRSGASVFGGYAAPVRTIAAKAGHNPAGPFAARDPRFVLFWKYCF